MKRKITHLLPMAAALALASCRQAAVAPPSAAGESGATAQSAPAVPAPAHTVYDHQEAADSADAFSFRFFSQVCASQPEGNLMLSPLSAAMALGMVTEGAAGPTRDELLRGLGFGRLGAAALHAYYGGLVAGLMKADTVTTMRIASAAWADRQLPLEESYAKALARDYAAQVNTADFADCRTAKAINDWASAHTEGRIDQVVDELSPSLRLMLLNAVYFKGTWADPFDRNATRRELFRTDDGRTAGVQMMHRSGRMLRGEAAGFEAIELPYEGDAYTMVVLLPAKGTPLAEALRRLDLASWRELRGSMSWESVDLKLPRFEAKYSRRLNADLEAMGIRRMFAGGQADLSGISATPLCVDYVKQDSYVRVDEEGTEAAAVTSLGVRMTSIRPERRYTFHCDRPFAYFICERTTGTVLFAGRMARP